PFLLQPGCMRRLLLAFGFLLLALPARAEIDWGVRAGIVTDPTDAVIGAELVLPFARVFTFNPNVEQTFGERDMFALNADVHYDFYAENRSNAWIGAGVALAVPEGSDLDPGVNLLAGFGRRQAGYFPYGQAKVMVLDSDTRASFVFGVRF
ncbi:MAG TPA: hypothetical protein VNL91_08295, partial [Thermoanaerobaculia bacterium]|nr:hypothetical protein [Thermoanaerobaculia bacterium]